MRYRLPLPLYGLLLCSIGCSAEAKAERLIEKQIGVMEEMVAAVENGASEEAFKELKEEGSRIQRELEEVEKELTEEENEALKKKYEPRVREVTKKMTSAMMERMRDQMGDAFKKSREDGGLPQNPSPGSF